MRELKKLIILTLFKKRQLNIHYVSTLIYKQLSYLKAKQLRSVKVLQVMEYG